MLNNPLDTVHILDTVRDDATFIHKLTNMTDDLNILPNLVVYVVV
jgi:hypothetical protein